MDLVEPKCSLQRSTIFLGSWLPGKASCLQAELEMDEAGCWSFILIPYLAPRPSSYPATFGQRELRDMISTTTTNTTITITSNTIQY